MCGIVSVIAQCNLVAILIEGLKRLEYRDHDSAGIAVFEASQQQLSHVRPEDKVSALENAFIQSRVCSVRVK